MKSKSILLWTHLQYFLLSQLWQVSDNLWKTDCYPVDTGHQLEVLCTLDLRPVCTGYLLYKLVVYSVQKLNVEDNLYFLDHFLISSTPYALKERIWNLWSLWNPELLKKPPKVVYGKSFSSTFRNIHRNTLVLESLFNKVAGLHPCNLIKRRL